MKEVLISGGVKKKALTCEGYIMFNGTVDIIPKNTDFKPFSLFGTWLYKPDTGCWYCNGRSFTKDVVDIKEVE